MEGLHRMASMDGTNYYVFLQDIPRLLSQLQHQKAPTYGVLRGVVACMHIYSQTSRL